MINFFKKLFGIKEPSGSCCGGAEKSCCGGECESAVESKGANEGVSAEDKAVLANVDPNIVVGKILEIKAHPDASVTRVQITKCDLGNGETAQILCGGVNIAEGAIVPVAKVGTKFSETFQIAEREIRGEKSCGMICSRDELELSAGGDHEIWILPADMEKSLGTPIRDLS